MSGYLSLEDAARRLGLRVKPLRRVVRGGNFPDPAGIDAGQPYWQGGCPERRRFSAAVQ